MYDQRKGYAGKSPGQNVVEVLGSLTTRDLQMIVGPHVLPLLSEIQSDSRYPLITAAEQILRARGRQIFENQDLRKALLRNLSAGKLDELRARFTSSGLSIDTASHDIPELSQPAYWTVACGFFGLNSLETAVGAAPLQQQIILTKFSLFEHQRSVVRRAYERIGSGIGRTMIHMPTGSGKTRTAMHLVARVLNEFEPGSVVWLATSRELLEQAAETFEIAWSSLGNREVTLIRFWGARAAAPEGLKDGLLIAGLAKLHAWRERNSTAFLRMASKVRLVIMDEAHQAVAPTYRALIEALCESGSKGALLGLSATPGRSWNDVGADEILSDFFGQSKVVLEVGEDPNPVKYLLENGYLAKPSFRQIEYVPSVRISGAALKRFTKGDEYSAELLEKIASDAARNISIIASVKRLLSGGHTRVILFAISVEHAQVLAAGLSANGIVAPVVSGTTPADARTAILKFFKSSDSVPQVLCNYGVLTTGFDAPKTSAAIIARPTKSLVLYSQMVGRATRGPRAGGNESCEIMTVHDPECPGFGNVAEAFFNWEDVWNER